MKPEEKLPEHSTDQGYTKDPITKPVDDSKQQIERLRTMGHIIYALYALSFLFIFTAFAGVMMAHVKQGDTQTPWLLDQFRWQIRTFWFGMSWMFLSALLIPFYGIGVPFLAVAVIWFIYRIVKGWMRLVDYKSPYENSMASPLSGNRP